MIPKKFLMPIIDKDLPFNAYQMRGFEFGCLLCCGKNVYPFLYSFFTNVFLRVNWKTVDFLFDKMCWFAGYDVFNMKYMDIDDRPRQEWIDSMKKNMAEGNYAYGFFDEYYIPHKISHNRRHFEHAFLLYGYDDEEQVFFAVGYTENSKYESYKIPYNNFYEGFYSLRNIHGWIAMIHVNSEFSFEVDLNLFYKELNEYLLGTYTGKRQIEGEIYGIKAIETMINFIEKQVLDGERLDIRGGRFIAEYSPFMASRLKFFYDQGYIKKDYTEQYTPIIKSSKTVHLLIMKYNLTGNKNTGLNVVKLLREILDFETQLLTDVVIELSNYLCDELPEKV